MDDRLYWIWMQRAIAPGSLKTDALLRGFGCARAVYESPQNELLQYGLTKTELKLLADKSLDRAGEILNLSLKDKGWILTPEDALYPSLLRSIPGLPLVLYGYGELPDLDIAPVVGVVGTRATTSYGRRATALIAGGLALGGAVVVSGGANGVDSVAHEAALEAGGCTVAVQGCGLDIQYPSQNCELRRRIARSGAVISEYPPGTPALRHNFPLRNRMISGVSLGVCVTEAPEKSGALITARHAFEQGRDVFAVAGDMLTGRSSGTDALIRQGARLVTSAEEILEEYLPRFPDIINPKAAAAVRQDPRFRDYGSDKGTSANSRGKPPMRQVYEKKSSAPHLDRRTLSDEATKVLGFITDTPSTLEELIAATDLTAPGVMTALTELEMNGAIRCNPGQTYVLRPTEQ
jgi:DNA processing protein